jgi:hypothetical protein
MNAPLSISFHPEMALFRFVLMSCVLRGFSAGNVLDVRLGGNPCAALLIEKTAHFQIENQLVLSLVCALIGKVGCDS